MRKVTKPKKDALIDLAGPKEYRLFDLDKDLAPGAKIKGVIFSKSDVGDDVPVYLKITLEIPTRKILPPNSGAGDVTAKERVIPIFQPPQDITPTEGSTVIPSAVAGSNSTQLEITILSGGKVPGGVGLF